jgi:hypothetical protein
VRPPILSLSLSLSLNLAGSTEGGMASGKPDRARKFRAIR